MVSIAALCAGVLGLFAISLCLPALVALILGDWQALEGFLFLAIGFGFLSALTTLALTPRLRLLNRAGVFTAAAFMWVTFSLAAAMPFLLIEQLPIVEAVFEATSAAVTLGVTIQPMSDISSVMGLYRGLVAWQGGLLTLLLAVYVLGRYEVGGTPNRHLRYVLHGFESGDPRIVHTFFEVFVPYVAITLACAAALVVSRMTPFDALNVALNIISTNGFLPLQTGATVLNNVAGEIIIMVFMIIGATSIIWHRALINRRWVHAAEQTEARAFLLSAFLISVFAAGFALATPTLDFTAGGAILNAIFDVISIVSTTGITHDTRFGVGLPFELILAIALVGGCAYSTAGGLHVFRLASMLHHSANEVRRLVFPHAVLRRSMDENKDELRLSKAVWSASFLALISIVTASLVFSLFGIGMAESLGLAVGAFSSTGNLVAQSMGEPQSGLLMAIAGFALLARIELLVVLAAITRKNW